MALPWVLKQPPGFMKMQICPSYLRMLKLNSLYTHLTPINHLTECLEMLSRSENTFYTPQGMGLVIEF